MTAPPDPTRLSDAQLAEALAAAEAEARATQARAEALRSEQWRRQGRADRSTQWSVQIWGFLLGQSMPTAIVSTAYYGPSTVLAMPLLLASPLVIAALMVQRQPPDKRKQLRRTMQEFWVLVRRPALWAVFFGLLFGLLLCAPMLLTAAFRS